MTRHLLRDARPPFYWIEHTLLDRGLSANVIAVYNVLARHADPHRRCFPSVRHIAQTLRLGNATVRRALHELKAARAIRITPRTDDHGDRTSNLYELLLLAGEGWSATDPPGSTADYGGPPQTHGWAATDTELEPYEQEPLNKGEHSARDPLWERFCEDFRRRYGHLPRRTVTQMRTWQDLISLHPPQLLEAKIDSWWDHPLPHTFRGNRAFGAFLQWFDDIPVNGSGPLPRRVLTEDELKAELHAGTPLGRQQFRDLVGTLAEDAQIRVLLREGFAHDENDARTIIAACTADAIGA